MLRDDLYEAIRELAVIDVHSHMNRDNLAAGGIGEVVFYHMITYALRAAGMDEGTIWPAEGPRDLDAMFAQSMPYWPAVAQTGFGWCLRTLLRELYEFDEPITPASLPRLRDAFDARVAQPTWGQAVRERAKVRRILSSRLRVQPLEPGQADTGIRFTVESAPTSGIREHHTWPERVKELSPRAGREITTLAALREAVGAFYDRFDWSDKHALVAWVSSEADFAPADDSTIDAVLADCHADRRIGRDAARLLEAAFIRCICHAIRGKTATFQICHGIQFLTPGPALHPVTRSAEQYASGLAHLIGEFPDIHFNLLSGYEIDEPILCSLCLAYANVSLGGYWWGNFYPGVMHTAWRRRLDMVPSSRLCGFFSDGYCIDWIYARLRMTQRVLANVLSERVQRGFATPEQALQTAREILFETPRRLFLPDEQVQP